MIDFSRIDKVIHEKARLSVMTILMSKGSEAFQDLKAELGMSDGNLLTHLRTLVKEGYVKEEKSTAPDSARSWTSYSLTTTGLGAFQSYLKILEKIVNSAKLD